ncbi:hypothetical protein B296_00028202 [Ensete ventricosum]|uniref:Uncharacterized protein n=1 Tax=Ensete ventricosum TaxID=4639 RepID=A0A426Z462_ENSVE|nr:hypothetical protein B296_00028202 [Ensete ventricosum]
MLAIAEGEKGDGGSGKSSDNGFWGRTTRDSFAAVLWGCGSGDEALDMKRRRRVWLEGNNDGARAGKKRVATRFDERHGVTEGPWSIAARNNDGDVAREPNAGVSALTTGNGIDN